MKALFRCEKNWQKINVQRFSANFLFSKNGKCRSITYSGDFATLPFDMPIQFASFLDCFFITLLSFLYPSLKYCSLIFGVHCDLADTIHILKQINCCPYRKLHILQAVHLCYDSG